MANKKAVVLAGRDEEFDETVLNWCGCAELWKEHALYEDKNLIDDVLVQIPDLYVESEEWGGFHPGLSGYDFRLEIAHPISAKRAIRREIEGLIAARSRRKRG